MKQARNHPELNRPDLLESPVEPEHDDWQADPYHPGTAVYTEGYLSPKLSI